MRHERRACEQAEDQIIAEPVEEARRVEAQPSQGKEYPPPPHVCSENVCGSEAGVSCLRTLFWSTSTSCDAAAQLRRGVAKRGEVPRVAPGAWPRRGAGTMHPQ